MKRPVRVPKIDWSSTGNELVNARKGYGLAPPAAQPVYPVPPERPVNEALIGEVQKGQKLPVDDPQRIGSAGMAALQCATDGAQLCALGYHAWLPWLQVGRQWETSCTRCHRREVRPGWCTDG